MSETPLELLHKAKNFFKNRRVIFSIIGCILAIGVISGVSLMNRTTYVPLFKGPIGASDMTDIKFVLSEGKIKFRENAAGNNLEVSSGNINKAETLLAQRGLPQNPDAVFADAFGAIGISTTESDKKILFVIEKQREIEAKLNEMEFVKDASVTLAIPEPSEFIQNKDELKPSASIMVKPMVKLTEKQISAITTLVSQSIENLDKRNITIVDYDYNEITSVK